MNGFKIDIDETPDNYVYQFNQKKKKIITQIIKDTDEITFKAIQRYCEENNIIPNIISEDKLKLVLQLGIAEYNRKLLEKEK